MKPVKLSFKLYIFEIYEACEVILSTLQLHVSFYFDTFILSDLSLMSNLNLFFLIERSYYDFPENLYSGDNCNVFLKF